MKKNEELDKQVGSKLTAICQQHGFTQEDVARIINVSRTSIVNIEQGKQQLTTVNLFALCELYGLTPNDLLPPFTVTPIPDEIEQSLQASPSHKITAARLAIRRVLSGDI